MENIDQYVTPESTPVHRLLVKDAFDKLTDQEKLYAHYISQASWHGSKICLHQLSPESAPLFDVFQRVFSRTQVSTLRDSAGKAGVSKEDFEHFLQYVAVFYGNMGNYLSFGDTKFIPRLPQDKFEAIIKAASNSGDVQQLWAQCKDRVYSIDPSVRQLGLEDKGVSSYYSPNITESEIAKVQKFMDSISLSPYNTRLFKHDGPVYEIKIASAENKPAEQHNFEGTKIRVTYGDYSELMKLVADNLEKAAKYAANANQTEMLHKYVAHFRGGSINDHKDAQRAWIKDIGPVVETNIGFIESYRDPFGVRGEFEGFVAMVNKDMSKKFGALVANAEKFIANLPWPREIEKDKFLRPDFTSLDVLTFASSGVPAGINIPNYDDIRQSEGFKNVSLGNVIASRKENEKLSFLRDEDQEPFQSLLVKAFEVQVGIHELLGHGSGKLLVQEADGKFNFNQEFKNPVTGGKITSWYKPGETYDSVFLSLGSSLEECRAEGCGIYLCTDPELLSLFGYQDVKAQQDIYYINWLNMARAGVLGLEFYTPSQQKWRQAHMQGRYALMQVMLRAGNGLLEIKKNANGDEAEIILDREKIDSVGRPAVAKFLLELMTYKATADAQAATKFYDDYTSVNEEFLKLREIVMAKKKPRKVFVQAHTYVDKSQKVVLQEFADSAEGMIDSFVTRFGDK